MANYCLGCLEEIEQGVEKCPHCGYLQSTPPKEVYHLVPGTILKARYLVGRVIGYGGFGVTYIGFDLTLNCKVAIKEYLPAEFATRMTGQETLSVYTGEAQTQFTLGLKSFTDEAKKLAKFNNVPGVVRIIDTFHMNKTSYIVMELLEGETVKERMKREGKLPYEEAENIILEILATLTAVHPSGIIHRDISPANIFLTNDGRIKLLDFGAARYASATNTKSLSVILKPGYAPEEQYRSRGNQGPWTDVYAAAATMYKMITGVTPQESIERMAKDELKEPSKLGVKIDQNKENALMNALNIEASTRTQSAGQFIEDLTGGVDVQRNKIIQKKKDEGKLPLGLKIAAGCIPVLIAVMIFLLTNRGVAANNPNYINVPNIINMTTEEAKAIIDNEGLYLIVNGTVNIDYGESNLIIETSPATGKLVRKYGEVSAKLSKNEMVFMPNVLYWDIDEATTVMEEAGLNVKTAYKDNSDFVEGTVIEQEFAQDTPLSKNKLIKLTVAAGREGKVVSSAPPNLVGKTVDEAINLLKTSYPDMALQVNASEFSDDYDENVIMSEETFSESSTGIVKVKISKGIKYYLMPDFWLYSKEYVQNYFSDKGIKVEFTEEISNEYEEGLVISQNCEAGTRVYKGDTVSIALVKNERVNIPDLTGYTQANATKVLQDLGFKVSIYDGKTYSNDIAKGLVMNQSNVGEFIYGRTVTLYISSGPSTEDAEVPNCTNMYKYDAENALFNAGFNVMWEYEYSDTVGQDYVIRVSPTGVQKKGTSITITVSQGKKNVPVYVPDLSGVYYTDAAAQLQSLGFNVTYWQYGTGYDSDFGKVGGMSWECDWQNGYDYESRMSYEGSTVQLGVYGLYVNPEDIGKYTGYSIMTWYDYKFRITGTERTHYSYMPSYQTAEDYAKEGGWTIVDQYDNTWDYESTYQYKPEDGAGWTYEYIGEVPAVRYYYYIGYINGDSEYFHDDLGNYLGRKCTGEYRYSDKEFEGSSYYEEIYPLEEVEGGYCWVANNYTKEIKPGDVFYEHYYSEVHDDGTYWEDYSVNRNTSNQIGYSENDNGGLFFIDRNATIAKYKVTGHSTEYTMERYYTFDHICGATEGFDVESAKAWLYNEYNATNVEYIGSSISYYIVYPSGVN